jgi:uncharacterized protein YhbP (UPF0306 family)
MSLPHIEKFIAKHHILTLATCKDNTPQCATLFFAYNADDISFIVASDTKTEHIQNVLENSSVAGTIALETKSVGKIEGIQFKAEMYLCEDEDKKLYFKTFPYALAMNPTLWKIKLLHVKLTDNRLGFGKKIIWDALE